MVLETSEICLATITDDEITTKLIIMFRTILKKQF